MTPEKEPFDSEKAENAEKEKKRRPGSRCLRGRPGTRLRGRFPGSSACRDPDDR